MSRNRRFWLLIALTSFEGSNIPCPDLQPRRTRQTDNLVRSDFVQCTRSVFAPDLMRQCMGGSVPMVLTLPVDAPAIQHNLLHYASRDSANFSSHTGDHHTKLGDVFNVYNRANCRRIEEGVQDRQNPSNILGSVFKHDDPVLLLGTKHGHGLST